MVVTEEHEAKPLSDFVDDKVVLQKECSEEKICIICGAPNDATYRVCKVDECIGSLVRKELNISRLHEDKEPVCLNRLFDSFVLTKENNVKGFACEPDFHKPKSFENISIIL